MSSSPEPALASAAAGPPARVARFGHIDNLRAVAALLVAWTHLAESFAGHARPDAPGLGFIRRLPGWLNLGHVGVVLFFGISGFVIYGSLAKRREDAGRRFALSRFFRLYPAYWLSALAGLLVLWWLPGRPTPAPMLAANAAMLSGLVGQPPVLGLYWTLETELIFYALCWLLYRSGRMTRPYTLPVLIVLLVVVWRQEPAWIARGLLPRGTLPGAVLTIPRHLAVMFWGALCREAHEQTAGFRRGLTGSWKTWLAVALGALFLRYFALDFWHYVLRGGHSRTTGLPVPPPQSIAYIVALPIFCLWIAGPRINLRPLRWLGEISYSLYLFHPVVSALLDRAAAPGFWLANRPLGLYVLLGLAGTVAVSAVVFPFVERPAIRLGAWLAERGTPPGTREPVETPWKTVAP